MRTSRKEVEAVFALWAKVAGLKVAESYKDVGAYRLDYAACYGGYRIERICNESGGVSNVASRESAGAFVYALRLAIKTLEEIRLNERKDHVSHCPKMGDGCAHFTSEGMVK